MRKYLLLIMLLLSGISSTLAQDRTLTGVITDANLQPLPGATVEVQNHNIRTTTGADGKFTLTVPAGKFSLKITYVGYRAQIIEVGAKETKLDITLEAAEGQMGEVVVTALGVKRDKRSIGYSTATIKGEDLTKAGVTLNPALALYGKASGVGVNIGSGGPTGSVNIKIRGAAGLESFAKTRPLFVVDGVAIYDKSTSQTNTTFDPLNSLDYGSGINDLNAEDIESMEILKGAKATVLYGSQALNGVVLITTKSGKKTRGLGVNASYQYSYDKPFSYIDFQNEYGSGANTLDTATTVLPNGQRVRTLRASRFSFGPKFDGQQVMRYDSVMLPYVAYPDNFIDFFSAGSSSRVNVALSGGGQFGSARASFTHVDYQDIIDRATQKNNTFSFNGDFRVSPFAKFEFTNNIYSITTQNRRPNIEQIVAWGLNRDYDYNFLRGFYLDHGYRRVLDNYALPPSATRFTGVLWEQNQNTDIDKKFHTINSLKTTLTFTKHISLLAQAAVDYTNTEYTTENQIVQLLPQTTGGKFQWRKENTVVQNYQVLLNYDQGFNNDEWRVFAYGGWAYQQVNESNVFAGTGENGLRFPDWYSLGNDLGGTDLGKLRGIVRGSDLIYGILGSATLSWKNALYLQLDARNDWNSTLPPSHNSYFYPGASVVWNFTENFEIPKLRYGKLSMSWADVGGGPNVALQNRYFADNSFSVQPVYEQATVVGVFPPNSLFLGDILPFRKREFEVGLNTRWFEQSRLEAELVFYTNNIYNQIIPLNINPATGYAVANINSGNVKNWGYEISIKTTPVVTPKLRWDLTLTTARQYSKVIHLYEGINEQLIDGINNAVRVVGKEGQALGDIFMYDYARDPDGNKIVSANGSYSLNSTKYIKVGNVNPKAIGGLYSDLYLKGFNFHIGFDYKYGASVFSYSNQYLVGNGVVKSTLAYRDEEHGGLAYYIEQGTNKKIPWQHNQPPPATAVGGLVYHDGMILDGTRVDNTSGTTKYVKNDIIIASPAYYQTYISDVSTGWPPDRVYQNNYIMLRELAIDYTIPKRISDRMRLQKLSVNAAVRNLGYIYKSIPNIDPEGTLSAQGFVENSFYPSIRSFILGINISF